MEEPLLEDLFAAFRDRGDAAALAVVFDRTAGELLTLALHLAPETSAAEDLVQATFLAAIQGASSFERGRRVMPWLVGILANQAARARRDRARVVDPMRVEARAEPDPALAIEQSEILATLTNAIDELPETCRESVRRHVLDGDRAVDIARDSGAAPGTVRMQILRGLERLRRTLPAGLLSMSPTLIESSRMASIKSAVISAARSRPMHMTSAASSSAAGQSSAISVLATGGSIVMGAKVLIGLLVAFLVVLVSWRFADAPSGNEVVGSEGASSRPSASIAGAGAVSNTEGDSEHAEPARSAASRISIPASEWRLVGDVHGLDENRAEDTVITASVDNVLLVRGAPDARGHFDLDLSSLFVDRAPEELIVGAIHPANRDVSVIIPTGVHGTADGTDARGHELHVDLELEPFVRVKGNVVQASGGPVENPWVALYRPTGSGSSLKQGEFSSDGSFKLKWKGSGDVLLVAGARGFVLNSQRLHFEPGANFDAGAIRLGRGSLSLDGHVESSVELHFETLCALARRNAKLDKVKTPAGGALMLGPEGAELCEVESEIDATGAFAFRGLPPGEWSIYLQSRGIDEIVLGGAPVVCTVPGPTCVLGRDLCRTTIEVRSQGAPVPEPAFLTQIEGMPREWTSFDSSTTVLSDANTTWEMQVLADGFATGHVTIPSSGAPVERHLDVDLEPRVDEPVTFVLTASDPASVPEEFGVLLDCLGDQPRYVNEHFKGGEGRYELTLPCRGHWHCVISPQIRSWYGISGGSYLRESSFDVDATSATEIVKPLRFEQGGRVHFEIEGWSSPSNDSDWVPATLHDATGSSIPAGCVLRRGEGGSFQTVSYNSCIPLFAASELPESLEPGQYTLTIEHPNWTSKPVTFDVKVGETTQVHVVVARR